MMREVLLGQPNLSYLWNCRDGVGTCTVEVQSLGVYFGSSREKRNHFWRGVLVWFLVVSLVGE